MQISSPNPEPRTSNPRRAAVLGWPVAHSLSPRLHGYWLKTYKIDGSYEALAVKPEQLAATLEELREKGYRGVNLTVPHKEAALKLVDHLDPAAQHIGAVNTVLFGADGRLEGRNTDAYGLRENLRAAGVHAKGETVLLLGAGGAARAALAALGEMEAAYIRIMNRTRGKAAHLAESFPDLSVSMRDWGDAHAFEGAGLLINATSLGMQGQPPLDLALDALPKDAVVADLVYAPLETDLLKRARARGHKTVDGLGMLLHQARPAFQAFYGVLPEVTDELRRYML